MLPRKTLCIKCEHFSVKKLKIYFIKMKAKKFKIKIGAMSEVWSSSTPAMGGLHNRHQWRGSSCGHPFCLGMVAQIFSRSGDRMNHPVYWQHSVPPNGGYRPLPSFFFPPLLDFGNFSIK
jgi:hypothetical protein